MSYVKVFDKKAIILINEAKKMVLDFVNGQLEKNKDVQLSVFNVACGGGQAD